jgi:rhamnosyltransferase
MDNNTPKDAIEGKEIKIDGLTVKLLEKHKTNPDYKTNKRQIFIIGAKSLGAYGGYETFVQKLVECRVSPNIRYHVARMGKENFRFEYDEAKCFNLAIPEIGSARAIYYDLRALKWCIDYCKARPSIKKPIFYVLACRIGPFIKYFNKQIKKLGGELYVNPDGHEWLRSKWSAPVRRYWKLSEKLMVKHADLLICDSKNIEKYIQGAYAKYEPKTTWIAYGADLELSSLTDADEKLMNWYKEKGLTKKRYYLVVGRFVPENSYEVMIREFMKSATDKDFAIITTEDGKFYEKLRRTLRFDKDKRIKFVGTVYDQELLKKIRENAYGYFHGHTVGGTNPSLIEALGSTDLNLLVDVGFNREVAEDGALYWGIGEGELSQLIDQADQINVEEIKELGLKAKRRVKAEYTWEKIIDKYERLWLRGC